MPDLIDPNRFPHYWYIATVVGLLVRAGGPVEPTQWWLSDCADDGTPPTLSAQLRWEVTSAPDLYPHGLVVFWDREGGWERAAADAHGGHATPLPLRMPVWARPSDAASGCALLLCGVEPAPTTEVWNNALVPAAVDRWRPA